MVDGLLFIVFSNNLQFLPQIKPWLQPFHTEVEPKCNGVVFITNPQYVRNLKPWKSSKLCFYFSGLLELK